MILLFDADGVLTIPEDMFSVVYPRTQGVDPKPIENFFKENWKSIVIGNKDLKEAIAENMDAWQWNGTIDTLLEMWFQGEDIRNEDTIDLVRSLRARGISCYLATEQERYRGEYMQNIMFKDLFDDYFISAQLGFSKTDPRFFEAIIERLKQTYPGLKPSDIVFFDDSQSKVDTACSVGINGQLFTSAAQVKTFTDTLIDQAQRNEMEV